MIEITKDKKADVLIITKTDKEGFHHQLSLTFDEFIELLTIGTDPIYISKAMEE